MTTELIAIALALSPIATAPPVGCELVPNCINKGKKGFCQSRMFKVPSLATDPDVATPAPVPVVVIVL